MTCDNLKVNDVNEEDISEPAAKRRRIPNSLYDTTTYVQMSPEADTSMNSSILNDSVVVKTEEPSTLNTTKIALEAEFTSYEEFKTEFEAWKKQYNHPFRVASSETLKDADGNVDSVCHYRYVVYQCAHYGQPRKRGNGSRPNQNYLPCGCEAMLRICYHFKNKTLRISQLRQVHTGHVVAAAPLSAKNDSKPKRRYSRKVFSLGLGSPASQKEPSPSDGESSRSFTATETSVSSPETKSSESNDSSPSLVKPNVSSDNLQNFYNNLLTLHGKVPNITNTTEAAVPDGLGVKYPNFPQAFANMSATPTSFQSVVKPTPVVPTTSAEPALPVSTSTVGTSVFKPVNQGFNPVFPLVPVKVEINMDSDKENQPQNIADLERQAQLATIRELLDEMFLLSGNTIYDFVKINRVNQIKTLHEQFLMPKKTETKKKQPEIVKQHPKPHDNTRQSSNELKIKEAIAAGLLLERDDEQTINECPSNWGPVKSC
ncbi:unnamed protein product [Auanema sp. JU1783]|nr:unnamed protein product [Auanema sp. JU1783]